MSSVVCITGASSGIGQATACAFARRGAHLVLGARRLERLHSIESELRKLGAASVLSAPLDVRDQASVKSWVETAKATHKNLDILVNNAGLVIGMETIELGNEDDWSTIFETNVLGVMRVTKEFIPIMKAQKSGHIIMLGSIAGHQPYEGGSAYCASKFGIKAIAAVLKQELNGTGIRISSIDPGMVETEFSLVRFRGDEDRAKSVYKGLIPLSADDIAHAIVFVSSQPSHVNIDTIVLTPTAQASVYKVHREL